MKILVRDQRKPELRTAANNASRAALEECLEALLSVCHDAEPGTFVSVTVPHGPHGGSLTNLHKRVREPLVVRLAGPRFNLKPSLHHI